MVASQRTKCEAVVEVLELSEVGGCAFHSLFESKKAFIEAVAEAGPALDRFFVIILLTFSGERDHGDTEKSAAPISRGLFLV